MSERVSRLISHLKENEIKVNPLFSRFRYTLDNGVLTQEERKFYEENGFILRNKYLTDTQVKRFNDRFSELCENPSQRSKFMLVMRNVTEKNNEKLNDKKKLRLKSDIVKLQDWQNDSVLMEYAKNPTILKTVSAFTGKNIHSIHTMYINKPPDKGNGSSRHPPHQDLWYFPFRPADLIVASWTALEKIDEKNGCLYVLPGSHKSTLLNHCYPIKGGVVNKAYHQIKDFDISTTKNLKSLHMEPGDTVFFHPLLFHGSGPNKSKHYRRAISTHFASAQCHQIKLTPGDTQWSVKQELEEMALKQKIGKITFHQIWQLKNRCLQGKRGLNKWGIDTDSCNLVEN